MPRYEAENQQLFSLVGERRLPTKQSTMSAWHICQTTQELIVSLIIDHDNGQLLTKPVTASSPNLQSNLQSICTKLYFALKILFVSSCVHRRSQIKEKSSEIKSRIYSPPSMCDHIFIAFTASFKHTHTVQVQQDKTPFPPPS